MKKSVLKRMTALAMSLVLAAGIALTIGSTEAQAASSKARMLTRTLWVGQDFNGDFFIDFPENGKVTKVTSSNQAALKVTRLDTSPSFHFQALKAGKSKVTVTYKVGAKTYKTNATFTVKKYPNAFKTVTVNGKKVKTSLNKFTYGVSGYTKTSAKVKVTLKKGWTVQRAYVVYPSDSGGVNSIKMLDTSVVLKGKAIKVPKGTEAYVYVEAVNSAGDLFDYNIRFMR